MKRTLIVSISMVLLALCVMLIGFNLTEARPAPIPEPVLLLVEDDTGAFFRQLRLGAQKAVGEAGGELITETVQPDELNQLADEWLMRGCSGAVVCIEDAALRQALLDALDRTGLPVMLVGSQDLQHSSIFWSDEDLGQRAAELAAEATQVYLAGGSEKARQAALKLLDGRLLDLDALDLSSPDHAIVALDAATTQELCQQKVASRWQCALYGVDPGETRVAVLEDGTAQALLFISPYAAGYQAAAQTLAGLRVPLLAMNWHPVWPENMYAAQHVKLVFPLLN